MFAEYATAIPKDEAVENVASIVIRFLNDLDPKMNKQTDLFSSDSKSWLHAANHLAKGAKRGEKVSEAQQLERVKGLLLQLEPSSTEVFRYVSQPLLLCRVCCRGDRVLSLAGELLMY